MTQVNMLSCNRKYPNTNLKDFDSNSLCHLNKDHCAKTCGDGWRSFVFMGSHGIACMKALHGVAGW